MHCMHLYLYVIFIFQLLLNFQEVKRQEVIYELIKLERSYCELLLSTKKCYADSLEQHFSKFFEPRDPVIYVFAYLDRLIQLHSE